MKMPEPIIDPATSMVESSKPRPLTNLLSAAGGCDMELLLSFKLFGFRGELTTAQPDGAMSKRFPKQTTGVIDLVLRQLNPIPRIDAESCFAARKGRELADGDVLAECPNGQGAEHANE